MLEDIIRLLHEGKHSLVVSNGEVRTFDRRGVADLYALLQEDSDFLKGASGTAVPHIINRTKTGWCPLETCCRYCLTPQDCLVRIEEFITLQSKRMNSDK